MIDRQLERHQYLVRQQNLDDMERIRLDHLDLLSEVLHLQDVNLVNQVRHQGRVVQNLDVLVLDVHLTSVDALAVDVHPDAMVGEPVGVESLHQQKMKMDYCQLVVGVELH
jgi:hypothetical protein